ncbi:hypothetical protein SDJN02_21139, partial [Cucurbita argyrosperma subsp. argyrosperma]
MIHPLEIQSRLIHFIVLPVRRRTLELQIGRRRICSRSSGRRRRRKEPPTSMPEHASYKTKIPITRCSEQH